MPWNIYIDILLFPTLNVIGPMQYSLNGCWINLSKTLIGVVFLGHLRFPSNINVKQTKYYVSLTVVQNKHIHEL